jgi:hypothetical protein
MLDVQQPPAQYQIAQAGIPPGAQRVETGDYAPPSAKAIRFKITVQPDRGALLVYTPGIAEPIRFEGPTSTKDVPLTDKFLFVLPGPGTTAWTIEAEGWTD